MARAVKGARLLKLPRLDISYSRKLPAGTKKLNTAVTVPLNIGMIIRQKAIELNRPVSDIYSEALMYWLDGNYPDWDLEEVKENK